MSAAVKPARLTLPAGTPHMAALMIENRDKRINEQAARLRRLEGERAKLVEALRYAANELDLLYAHAINNGISEAETPPHRMVRDILREIGEAE